MIKNIIKDDCLFGFSMFMFIEFAGIITIVVIASFMHLTNIIVIMLSLLAFICAVLMIPALMTGANSSITKRIHAAETFCSDDSWNDVKCVHACV